MRRSKSNPAKYARNYRKISQRKNTGYDDGTNADEREKKRLEAILKQSEQTWKRGLADNGHYVAEASKQESTAADDEAEENAGGDMLSLLSPELREQFAGMASDNILVLPGTKKKNKRKRKLPPLTPEETKAAKALFKQTQRKLNTLLLRKKQKELRSGLYKQLEENSLGSSVDGNKKDKQSLLLKSSELGKKVSKKQLLKQLRKKESMGMKLTEEEMGVLYVKYEAPGDESFAEATGSKQSKMTSSQVEDETDIQDGDEAKPSQKKKKRKKRKANDDDNVVAAVEVARDNDSRQTSDSLPKKSRPESPTGEVRMPVDESPDESSGYKEQQSTSHGEVTESTEAKVDYSQMMLAGLSTLKSKTDARNTELAIEKAKRQQEEEEREMQREEEERKKRKVYVPSETIEVSTMHLLERPAKSVVEPKRMVVMHIDRPEEINEKRYDLPVSAMEFEIVDAVRSNDCTILCGETGSGKSTQVPQFLYESGFSTRSWWDRQTGRAVEDDDRDDGHLIIGITQPRRVAAVSTAKRVCYEMGKGNGQSISSNNLVAYQTRYETAGLGRSTHVKFMTDGVLLQEIQSDLLLRKYGAIVLDEAHERNLNTDVLLGLLSVALPLRRKAAEEGSLPPLKLVVMSATLRVEDFTENKRLFPGGVRPALVKVPGRTHPVSIHHSKVTELDNYEKVALDKVIKIHRRLPSGGILVFLTGKQEIVRMINRLHGKLEKNNGTGVRLAADAAKVQGEAPSLRELDDEEVDGDLFQEMDGEDEDDFSNMDNDDLGIESAMTKDDDGRPKKVRILPLYSMLSPDEQAKVFEPVPEDTRLIVCATNLAETSITIPGISYVVDSGRQKCRNFHAGTGVASYDVMWISKAAADQRAGRAGRTGPGHCYRLYSSSVYTRYFDQFAIPEVLSRPLEDVVLAMKAMNVSNVTAFPFPTSPSQTQINAAVRLLANLGCIDTSQVERDGGDGTITKLGRAVSQLPLGVRYGKMMLVAAQADVLDYAIALVAILSEKSPFDHCPEDGEKGNPTTDEGSESLDDIDRRQLAEKEKEKKREARGQWQHDGGDVLAALKAVGAYAFAGRGAGGLSEKMACRNFCRDNGLNATIMERIAKMRLHLCKLAKTRLPNAGGVASETGRFSPSMPPPKRLQECLLRQAIASGLLDNVARRAPPGTLPAEFSGISRSAYICGGNASLKEALFIDNNSTLHNKRPEWVCYDSIVRKAKKDGTTVAVMQRVTPVDPDWLASVCAGSILLKTGKALAIPTPRYDRDKDSIQCAVETRFGFQGWEVPPCFVDMNCSSGDKKSSAAAFDTDECYRWFARYLLEGRVIPELEGFKSLLNECPSIITKRKPSKKVTLVVSALSDSGICTASALRKHWAEKSNKFLFKTLKLWVKPDETSDAKRLWISAVNANVDLYRSNKR